MEEEYERQKEKKLEDSDGLLDYLLTSIITDVILMNFGENRKEARKLEDKISDNPNARVLEISTCSQCGGSGINDNHRTGDDSYLTECQRCTGVGRMATKYGGLYDSIIEVSDSCEVCLGEGTVTVDGDPPFVTCTNCEGYGRIGDGGDIITCPICQGYGFSTPEDLQTVG